MMVSQVDDLQEIYVRIGRVITDISTNVCKTDIDEQSVKLLKEAQDCVMDAVIVAIEHSFSSGNLAVAEL